MSPEIATEATYIATFFAIFVGPPLALPIIGRRRRNPDRMS